MQIIHFKEARNRLYVGKTRKEPDGETERAEHLAHHKQHAPDRGPPLRIKRHGPVNGGEGNTQRVKDDPKSAQILNEDELCRRSVAGFFLLRPANQFPVEQPPSRKINQSTDNEEGGVEIV